MNVQRKALWLAIASVGFGAGFAQAQDEFGFEDSSAKPAAPVYENFIELGVGTTEDGNGKFGEYTTGLNDSYRKDGAFGAGAFRWTGGDSESATTWNVQGGVGTGRILDANYGVQGNYMLELYADRVQKVEYGEALTIWPEGGTTLTLPPGFVVGPTKSPSDRAFYRTTDIKSQREILGFKALKQIDDNWSVDFDYTNQEKGGEDIMAINQGFNGAALVAEPLDYKISDMTARVAYHDSCLQSAVELYYSEFEHGNDTLTFQNPEYAAKGLDYEQMDLEPDNEFARIGIDGGYNFDDMTRLSWFADWSRGEQDDDFVPPALSPAYYEASTNAAAGKMGPLLQTSLDGEVERTSLKLVLVGRPLARLDYRAEIDYKDKDATHDPGLYQDVHYNYIGKNYDWTSIVYDKESTAYSLEGGYRLPGGLRLRGGYTFETIDRDSEEIEYDGLHNPTISFTDSTDEDRYWAELKLPRLGGLSVSLKGEYDDRTADLSHETEEFLGNTAAGGIPIRATPYFLLAREQEKYELSADYLLTDSLTLSASYENRHEDFDNDTNGLQSRDADVWNASVGWGVSKALTASAYYSYEEYDIHQLGRVYSPNADPRRVTDSSWYLNSQDEGDGFGVSLDWAVIEDKFDLTMDLAYLDYSSDYVTVETVRRGGVNPGAGESLPSEDEVTRLTLKGVYQFNSHLEFSGRYVYEERESEGWSWDPTLVTGVQTLASTLAFGWEEPDYDSQLFLLSARYKF